jgi:hypothetical protein
MARFLTGCTLLGCLTLAVAIGCVPCSLALAQEPGDTRIGVLAGEWKITYTHDAVRVYAIEMDGRVSFAEENLKGQIRRKGAMLLLVFEGDDRLERLTLGTDGRLFVEHYNPKGDFPEGKAKHVGIGVRQK